MKTLRRSAALLLFVVSACSASSDPIEQSPAACIAGATHACLCDAASKGVQVCLPDGTYGSCRCSPQGGSGGFGVGGADPEADCGAGVCQIFYADADADGSGLDGTGKCLCAPDFDHSAKIGGDCDDTDPAVHPGAEDTCDDGLSLDNDCDGQKDEDATGVCETGGPVKPELPVWHPIAFDTTSSEVTYKGHPDNAVDIGVKTGTPVHLTKDGEILEAVDGCEDNTAPLGGKISPYASCGGGYGNHVRARHPDGSETIYGHLKKGSVKVVVGEYVCAGQPIGLSGASGKVTSAKGDGAHLHFGYKNPSGKWIYPPTVFADRARYRGGNAFVDDCQSLDALKAQGVLGQGCEELRQTEACTPDRAALAKALGEATDVDKTAIFGACDAPCLDMAKGAWYYDWVVAMTLLTQSDAVPVYQPSLECKPEEVPRRIHALKASMEAFDIGQSTVDQAIPDADKISSGLLPYANGAALKGILLPGERLWPDQPLTYDWLARTITRRLEASAALPVANAGMAACPAKGCPGSCDDGNPCTGDVCIGSSCQHTPAADGTPCGTGMLCQVGSCQKGCSDACSPGDSHCKDGSTQQNCVVGPGGCYVWGQDTACSSGCVGSACASCTSECVPGQKQCDGPSLQTCVSKGACGSWSEQSCSLGCNSSTSSCCAYSVTPQPPNFSNLAAYTLPGGIVMSVAATLDASGYLTVHARKSAGGAAFGDGTYRVLVFSPNAPVSEQCKPWNTERAKLVVSGSPTEIAFPAFDSLLTCGEVKKYCVVKEDGGTLAYWGSGEQTAQLK